MNQLSSRFLKVPRYAKDVSLLDGTKIKVACPEATRSLLALMDMGAVLGGAASHWGGPSAFLEIFISVFGRAFHQSPNWFDLFHIINDAGHCENALYALKANYEFASLQIDDLKKFRSLSSFLTGHGESHLFPEGVYLSNGPLGSTLAQAQGLCMADKMQNKKRTTIVFISDGALMEGEAKEALASIPGFAQKNLMNPFLLIVSHNDTKLSGRISEDSFSMTPTLESLSALGWESQQLDSPHNLQETFSCIDGTLTNISSKPVALLARTTKGYGVQETEKSSSGGHGFPLKDPSKLRDFLNEIYQGKKIPEEFLTWVDELKDQFQKKQSSPHPLCTLLKKEIKFEKVQVGISKALVEKKEEGFPLVSVSSDLQGSTGVNGFRKKFPKQSIDVGVAESNMISLAAGLSKQGFIPVVDTFAQFGVTKGSLPLFMSVLSQAPVIAVFSHAGFQDAADGASHQCLTYLAQTGSIPQTCVYTLSSSEEAYQLMKQAISCFKKEKKNHIFFIGRENFPSSYVDENYSYQLKQAQIVFEKTRPSAKKGCTIMATGTLLSEALQAGIRLAQKDWNICVVHASCINHPDLKTLQKCLAQTQNNLLTLEDHQIKGGLSSFLSQALCLNGVPFKIRSLGVKDQFGRSAYQAKDLYQLHNLDSDSVIQEVLSVF